MTNMQKVSYNYEIVALNSKGETVPHPKYKGEEQKPPLLKIAIFTMLATLAATGTLTAIAWLLSLVVN